MTGAEALDGFSPATRAWFDGAFAEPTQAQAGAWRAIGKGEDTLVVAPTGSGKTLAAFLWAIDKLAALPPPADPKRRTRVLYVSPLKALAVDIERNLRAPLTGIGHAARRLGLDEPDIRVAVRTGDTAAEERRKLVSKPPDILITTPESLFLLLTSQARETLRGVETVIVDEVHAVAGNKRGAHLALSLERLDALRGTQERGAQRVGLSATVRPVEEVATFLGGTRAVTIVQPPSPKRIELRVVVPVEDMTELDTMPGRGGEDEEGPAPRRSIWPHVEERVLDLIEQHKSTIVFANSRRLAERLCGRLNELAAERAEAAAEASPNREATRPPAEMMAQAGAAAGAPAEVARAHHGSVSRQERAEIEEALKAGRLPAVVATSSLELGIDMGAVDLVVQVEAPPSVASGLQRVGRAGHNVGDVSRGIIFPKYQGDLVQAAVVAERMRAGAIEELKIPHNPLDVLAQQIVAMTALDDWRVDELEQMVRNAAPFSGLTRPILEAVLDMLAGRYPSEEFAGLRPRLVWDRVAGTVRARPGAQRLAVTSGGTIPDRGLFGVFLASGNSKQPRRVGELDEEMVYESRVGDVFVLGASSWRIEDITPDRVLVTPAPGRPGKLPFWHGDTPGRPAELGRAIGAACRELAAAGDQEATAKLEQAGLDELAARNLIRYLAEQRAATGYVPDDRTLVVERFRDELGDWRVVLHSPYGDRVHAPWALAIAARLRERYGGMDVQALHTDDGIIIRVPDSDEPPPTGIALLDPDDVGDLITAEVGASALFASRFRECASRALLLPRRQPNRRTPLWQQRQRSAQLLEVASQYPAFPIVLETVRECLRDVFDVPALTALLRDIAARRVRVVEVETQTPSPFGKSLLFRYVGAFMYEGDAPLAERRAQALSLDPALLAELLGTDGLRELLDPAVIADTERDLQHLSASRRCRDLEGVADLLRTAGPLTADEVAERCTDPGAARDWLGELSVARRTIQVRIAGQPMWAAIEDAGRLRDALGVPLPVGVPEAFTEPVADPLGDLMARYARTHGPFTADAVAGRYGLGVAVVTLALRRLAAGGRVVEGEFLPAGQAGEQLTAARGTEWCDAEVLRLLRRRCLARLRKEAEPVPPEVLARFLPAWHGIGAAAGRAPASRRGRGPGGARAAGRRAGAGLGAGNAGAARPGAWLLPRPARRADLGGRDRLVRGRRAARRRRLAGARARRRRAAAAARTGRGEHDPAAFGGARGAERRRCAVLPDAQRPGRRPPRRAAARRRRGRGRDLGPGVVRAAHQRHARPAPGAARRRPAAARGRAGPAPCRARDRTPVRFRPAVHAGPHRAADGQRPVVAAARPGGRRSDRAGARARAHAARAARRADQGRGGRRADPGRLRRGVPGAARDGGGRPVPPRLLRRGTRRGPVRAARGGGQDAGAGPGGPRGSGGVVPPGIRQQSCWPRPTRPSPTGRRCPGRIAPARRPPRTGRAARRAR